MPRYDSMFRLQTPPNPPKNGLTALPSIREEPAAPLRTRAVAVDLLRLQTADDGEIGTRTTVGGVAIHIRTAATGTTGATAATAASQGFRYPRAGSAEVEARERALVGADGIASAGYLGGFEALFHCGQLALESVGSTTC